MKKYIKYIIILVILIGILIGINYFFKPSMDEQIKSYLINLGYSEGEDSNLLTKNDTNDSKLFSLGDYTLMLNKDEDINGMKTSLNATYDYKEENIIYSYRVNYSDTINVWFKGTYDKEKFICNKEFASAELSESQEKNICNLANTSIKLFDLEAKTLFKKYKFIDYIKNK